MPQSLVGLGANLGNRGENLRAALRRLNAHRQIRVLARSGLYHTRPLGGPADQPPFLNAAAVVETSLPAEALLRVLQGIQTALGRRAGPRWGPRPIDLDLLLYDRQVVQTAELTVPHPRMAFRPFVLEPAAEVAPHLLHPRFGWTVGQLWKHLQTAPRYVAVAGPLGRRAARLATRAARLAGWRRVRDPLAGWLRQGDPATGLRRLASIQSLRTRAEPLQPKRLRCDDQPRLSGWWIEQSRSAAVLLPLARREAFRRAWQQVQPRCVPPKLLVLAGDAVQRQVPDGPADTRRQASWRRYERRFWALARRPRRGPFFELPDEDDLALAELTAALQALA